MSVEIPEGIQGRLVATALIRAKSGQEERLESLLKAVRDKSATEPGTEIYRISKRTDGLTFFVYQEYTNLEEGKKHLSGPELKKLQAAMKDIVDGQPDFKYFGEIP